jgi:hypothetical protein
MQSQLTYDQYERDLDVLLRVASNASYIGAVVDTGNRILIVTYVWHN